MEKIKVAIIAMGNIGRSVYDCILSSKDMSLSCIFVRSSLSQGINVSGVKVVHDLNEVTADVAIITAPSRISSEISQKLLLRGIACVDCFDIHSQINDVRKMLGSAAVKGNTSAITAAGWDPGTDSVIRTLMLAMSPNGITYTNFGPGVSMGHTVCAKGKEGVEDALSLTYPKGEGLHRRIVYVKLKPGFTEEAVSAAIKSDAYFSSDETHVRAVSDIDSLKDLGHGVNITRKASSGTAANQLFSFDMRINNPALTAQVMVSCARAVLRQRPGCYTMPEIPPLDYLYGDREQLISKLV